MSSFKRLIFIINPNAGVHKKEGVFTGIVNMFFDYGYTTTVLFTRKAGDATEFVEKFATSSVDLIVCMGGDGTLNETLRGVNNVKWRKPFGYIPAGSTNDYASSLGLPTDPIEAAKRIMTGKVRSLDLGMFNDSLFVYTACVGLFTNTSYETPQKVKNVIGHLAYVLEGMKDMTQFKPVYVKIDTGEQVLEDNYIYVGICNTYSLGGVMKLDDSAIDLGDGAYELLAISMPRDIFQTTNIITALLTQKYETCNLIHFSKITHCEIYYPRPGDWSLDGERGKGKEKNVFDIIPDAVNFLC